MEGKAVTEIERLVREGTTVEVDGQHFSAHQLHRIYDDPRPESITVRTLTGFVDFMASEQGKGLLQKAPVIIVQSHSRVHLLTEPYGDSENRDVIVSAILDRPTFQFGDWMEPEKFNIALAALFDETDDLKAVMAYAGKMTIESGVNLEDDGITQRTSVKKGITGGLTESQPAPVRVLLQPYRTFDEVHQPMSDFIFRVRVYGENSIQCALFEADAGSWKSEAAGNIRDWINETKNNDIPVIS